MIEFIKQAGGCLVSKNVLSEAGRVKWCFREESMNPVDNGWRFLSEIDTDEYLADAGNMAVCDYNTVANIEPAVIAIYNYPVGTELELVYEGGKRTFVDCNTGKPLNL